MPWHEPVGQGARAWIACPRAPPRTLDRRETLCADAKPMCVVCENDDPDGVSDMQRCDGGCDRWFCIEGMCASALGIPFDKYLSAGDLVCADCAPPGEKLQVNVNALAAMPEMGFLASDEQ